MVDKYVQIKLKADELARQEKMTTNLRNIWSNGTRERLYNHLKYYAGEIGADWDVDYNDIWLNKNSVILHALPQQSGIIKVDQEPNRHYLKFGAQLAFSQLVNGLISVVVVYPYIEEMLKPIPNKVLDRLNPRELTDDRIDDFILEFLDELIAWEKKEPIE